MDWLLVGRIGTGKLVVEVELKAVMLAEEVQDAVGQEQEHICWVAGRSLEVRCTVMVLAGLVVALHSGLGVVMRQMVEEHRRLMQKRVAGSEVAMGAGQQFLGTWHVGEVRCPWVEVGPEELIFVQHLMEEPWEVAKDLAVMLLVAGP
jgi:hypothetical protein